MIETQRLILRPFKMSDCDDVARICNNEKFSQFLLLPFPYTKDMAKSWISTHKQARKDDLSYDFAITDKKTKKLIGSISLMIKRKHNQAEVGYWICPDFSGKGIATESLKSVLNFGFNTLKLHKIYALHFIENLASGRVMEKCGLKYVATLHDHALKNGIYHDVKYYELVK